MNFVESQDYDVIGDNCCQYSQNVDSSDCIVDFFIEDFDNFVSYGFYELN